MLLASLILTNSVAYSASSLKLKQLLSIKPSDDVATLKKQIKIKTSDAFQNGDYHVEVEGNKIKSVRIDLKAPVESKGLVSNETKGFCLVQPMAGDVAINRVFFFNMENKSRYELTHEGKIKSILIQDIPGARANRPCQFSELTNPQTKK